MRRPTIQNSITHLRVVEGGVGPSLQDDRLAIAWSEGFDVAV